MRIVNMVIVLDARDVVGEARFWASVLGGEATGDDHWQSIIVDGRWIAGVQHAPDHQPPHWPEGPQQQQIHLDVHVDDLEAAGRQAVAAGGRLVVSARGPVDNPEGDELFATYASPAGHLVDFGLHRGP
ncbi:VOC family protein [Acidipropionibacterium timonense]|uniref:VOC family protein n=1 Tax=Acidipropionibacterium timonense TaxID=2161818 RepID=UPI001031EA69|nr:VOC family protein [Acidipropionibacterium timonense]